MYQVPDQSSRTVVVTGANSGTGREAAERLAAAGAHVVLAVRNPEKGAIALAEITAAHPEASVEVRIVDLASLASVAAFTEGLERDLGRLDTLINNAGVMAPPRRFETEDGFELQMGSNYLGPFALTTRLLPLLLEAPMPRVTTMSSGVANAGRIHFDDLQWAVGDTARRALTRSRSSPTCCLRGTSRRSRGNGAGRCAATPPIPVSRAPTCRRPVRRWVGRRPTAHRSAASRSCRRSCPRKGRSRCSSPRRTRQRFRAATTARAGGSASSARPVRRGSTVGCGMPTRQPVCGPSRRS